MRPLYAPVLLEVVAERMTRNWRSKRIWASDVGLVGILARKP